MVHNYSACLILLILALFTSCEEPVDFKIDEETRLVVESHFSINKDLVVYVSKTVSVVSQKDYEYVDNATISLFSNGEFLEHLEFIAHGNTPYYRSSLLNPVPGEMYTIKVEVLGFEPLTATESIPIPVPIKEVDFNHSFGETQEELVAVDFDVTVVIDDPVEYQNFYHLVFYQELIPYQILDGDTILSDEIFLGVPLDLTILDRDFPVENYYDRRSYLIDDATFNGTEISLPFQGNYTFNHSQYQPGNFIVELRTVSQAYYDYHSSLNHQVSNGDENLIDDNVIIDNIHNGEGIFAGYGSTVNKSKLIN